MINPADMTDEELLEHSERLEGMENPTSYGLCTNFVRRPSRK